MLSSRQLTEWMAYARVGGLPEANAQLRSGQILALTANLNRGKESDPIRKPEDYALIPVDLAEVTAEDARPLEDTKPYDPATASKAVAELLGKRAD